MIVKELIDALSDCDLESEVVFVYNSRDYWRNDVAEVVKDAREGFVNYSLYHDMYSPVDSGEEEIPDNASPVVIITGKGKLYR